MPVYPARAPRSCFVPRPLALAVALGWGATAPWIALAQDAAVPSAAPAPASAAASTDTPLPLQTSPRLQERWPAAVSDQLPTFVSGERLQGRPDLDVTIDGDARLRRGDRTIRADRIDYDQPNDRVRARGEVRIHQSGNLFEGPFLELKVDAFEGFFNQPRYRFLRNDAYGQADRMDFLDESRAVIHNATYTTCQRKPGPSWMPDWILKAGTIRIDQDANTGEANDANLSFKGVPILPLSGVSFPLTDERKSGLLPPTVGLNNIGGIEVTQPWYWNIAPNRDATLYPTIMSKRGVDLGGEFRYLEADYRGTLRGNFMPSDQLRGQDRWGLSYRHDGNIVLGDTAVQRLGVSLNLNHVSDDDYWRDFPRAGGALTQRLLPTDARLSWADGPLSLNVRSLKWQTLQNIDAPIIPPYDRLPQLSARYLRTDLPLGLNGSVEVDTTRFQANSLLTQQPNAQRSYAVGQLSWPWRTPGLFVVPKLQWHTTQYSFDTPLVTGATNASRTVHTVSLDAGLIFERNASYFGRAFLQTLEPRAFYVYTPFRDQSALPNYDTAPFDFNFSSLFTENTYVGQDRIADNKLLTLGVQSRLIDPATGAEALRLAVAQRVRLADRLVTLPGEAPVSERLSDLLFGASANLTRAWNVDTLVQYNPKIERSERITFTGRYNPAPYRVLSAAYRLQREQSEQLDVGWQWPVASLWGAPDAAMPPGQGLGEGRWYSVGRMNYSMRDRRLVDSIIGFEYDGGCWLGRVVIERLQSGLTTANKRVLFQLEFVGFTRLGTNALQTLKQNIPRYQFLREQTLNNPSRFTTLD